MYNANPFVNMEENVGMRYFMFLEDQCGWKIENGLMRPYGEQWITSHKDV